MNVTDYLQTWAASYKEDFVNNIMPFWMRYGLDHKNGGVYTCLDRDGRLMDTTKSVWFQGRFGFIAAYAYNQIEQNPDWLAASRSCIDFMEKHCFDKDGRMFFEVTEEGLPLRKRRYVFSECFAAIAMSEYALASGDRTYAEKALDLFKRILKSCHPRFVGTQIPAYIAGPRAFHNHDSHQYSFPYSGSHFRSDTRHSNQ